MIRTSVALEPSPGVPTTATTDTSVATTMEDLAVTTAAIQVHRGSSGNSFHPFNSIFKGFKLSVTTASYTATPPIPGTAAPPMRTV